MPFTCSICEEESTRICARCTKDACDNHLCEKCLKCSDCCECEVTLSDVGRGLPASAARAAIREAMNAAAVASAPQEMFPHAEPLAGPPPETPHPPPDPDPDPDPLPEDEPTPAT